MSPPTPTPTVSAILPAYNEEEWIAETIDSVLGQSFEDLELVVVDDGSTDDTAEIVRGYDDPRVAYHHQENAGSAVARNTALDAASGEYVAIIDADDVWLPGKLERQLAVMDRRDAEFSYTNMMLVDGEGNELGVRHESIPPAQVDRERFMRRLFLRNFVCHPTVVFHSDAVADRRFDEDLAIVNDHDLYLRIASEYDVTYVDEVLVRKRYHGGNISGSQNYEQLYEERTTFVDRNVERFPVLEAVEDRKRSQINLTYGINLAVDGHPDRGREAFRRAIRHDPTNWRVYAAYLVSLLGPSALGRVTSQR